MTATILRGDAITMLRTIPDASVHCVVTSPPYYGLRDYGIDGQIGLEATPAEYVDRLVAVFREVRRVLRLDGVCWLNIADSYASEPFAPWGIKPKDEMDIPHYLRIALRQDGWFARATNIWHKPNPMPESVTDRCTKAHEYVFLLTKSARYFYDAQAVAEPATDEEYRTVGRVRPSLDAHFVADPDKGRTRAGLSNQVGGRSTRNKRSVWTIATEPTPYAHFATMPTALAETCILAGCPAQVCAVCGSPWVRVVERETTGADDRRPDNGMPGRTGNGLTKMRAGDQQTTTIGFAQTCTCDAGTIPGTVLDPFAGSGTTLRVAVELGRNAIGIELNPEYADLADRLLNQTQPALFGI